MSFLEPLWIFLLSRESAYDILKTYFWTASSDNSLNYEYNVDGLLFTKRLSDLLNYKYSVYKNSWTDRISTRLEYIILIFHYYIIQYNSLPVIVKNPVYHWSPLIKEATQVSLSKCERHEVFFHVNAAQCFFSLINQKCRRRLRAFMLTIWLAIYYLFSDII